MTRRARNKYEQRERTSPLKQTKTLRYVQKKKKNDSPLDLERQLVEVGYRNSASPHKQWNTRNFVSFFSHEISHETTRSANAERRVPTMGSYAPHSDEKTKTQKKENTQLIRPF